MTDRNMDRRRDRSESLVQATFGRLDVVALGCALGVLAAVLLWGATAILLVHGAPPGVEVGSHLGLLSHFLPFYAVSWAGSFLGVGYGFIIGYVLGLLVGLVWNLSHALYLRTLTGNAGAPRDMDL
jgi:hypothetical protein